MFESESLVISPLGQRQTGITKPCRQKEPGVTGYGCSLVTLSCATAAKTTACVHGEWSVPKIRSGSFGTIDMHKTKKKGVWECVAPPASCGKEHMSKDSKTGSFLGNSGDSQNHVERVIVSPDQ